MDFVTGNVYHILGNPIVSSGGNIHYAQEANADVLRKNLGNRLVSPGYCSVQQLGNMLRLARKGDIFLYDGHGSYNGCIFLGDEALTGTALRNLKSGSNAHVYLLCCHSALVVAHGQSNDVLRAIFATILAYNPSGWNIKYEIDAYLYRISNGSISQCVDSRMFTWRVAGAVRQLGLDRIPLIFPDGIVPLSIGTALVVNDRIITSLFVF